MILCRSCGVIWVQEGLCAECVKIVPQRGGRGDGNPLGRPLWSR